MELVPYWKHAWKLSVIWMSSLLIVAGGIYSYLESVQSTPAFLKFLEVFAVSPATFGGFVSVAGVLISLLRVIKQSIPLPPEVKQELITAAIQTPVLVPPPKETQ
jgi:hypothetical protein